MAVVHRIENGDAQRVGVIANARLIGDEGELCAERGGVSLDEQQIELTFKQTIPLVSRQHQQNPIRLRPTHLIAQGMVVVVWVEMEDLFFHVLLLSLRGAS